METRQWPGENCPGFLYWTDILRFNWECILLMADRALARGLDVIVEDVVEEELPLATDLARRHSAQLRYAVLTASESEIRQRLEKQVGSHA